MEHTTGLSAEFGSTTSSRRRLWFWSRSGSQVWWCLSERGCFCCLPLDSALPDCAAWAWSGFARIPWLQVGVRFLGVGSLCAQRTNSRSCDVASGRDERPRAAPGHGCLCSFANGHGPVRPQENPSVFYRGGLLVGQGRILFDALMCKGGGVYGRGTLTSRSGSQVWWCLSERGCFCCLPLDSALPDCAAWAWSGFARIPWLQVGVRFLGVGSLCAQRTNSRSCDVASGRDERPRAAPGHGCLCSFANGHGPVRPQENPSVFYRGGLLVEQGRILFDALMCKGGGVYGGGTLTSTMGGDHVSHVTAMTSHSCEPKVIASVSLGHPVLFKLRRRVTGTLL